MKRAARLSLCALVLLLVPAPLAFAAGPADEWTATDPPIRYGHIAHGGINRHGEPVGYHHRDDGIDPPGARVVRIIAAPDANGVYRARVEIRDPLTGAWIDKRAPSTFFPDALSDRDVIAAILAAFHDGRRRRDGRFIGVSGRGFAIEGWYVHGRITAAYPLYGP
ncbi:MAG TPA: EndoU domain-containing protein [Stellaceae bacterium]|nr:EndoU domain-containing protein [Stellaceae bacterium]